MANKKEVGTPASDYTKDAPELCFKYEILNISNATTKSTLKFALSYVADMSHRGFPYRPEHH